MKIRGRNYSLILLLLFGVTVSAIAQFDADSYLKTYDTPKAHLRVGFIPYKAQIVFGEPEQLNFSVLNLGPDTVKFYYDWNHRGAPGNRRFRVMMYDSDGRSLPDPYPNIGGSWISTFVCLKPEQSFSNIVDLTDFCVPDKPGVYTVHCSYIFDESWKEDDQAKLVANLTFRLTILDRTPRRVAGVLDELVQKIKTKHGQDLKDTLTLMAVFGKDAAVSRLADLAENGSVEVRTAAIGALPLVANDATLKIALEELKDPCPSVQVAASGALGSMAGSSAVKVLLKALPKEKSPVAEAIIVALGASRSDSAFSAITNAFDHGDIEMQRAAIGGLANFGGTNAVSVLKQHINTNYLAVRYNIVSALGDILCQPIQPEWLTPVLVGRDENGEWMDSLRLIRLYGGNKAIPALLSYVDFDWAWSARNWVILNEVQGCPNAPHIDYEYDGSIVTPEQLTNNLRTLRALKPLAAQVRTYTPPPVPPPSFLKTDPPFDFTPVFEELKNDNVKIKSGFLNLELGFYQGAYSSQDTYDVSDSYTTIYKVARRLRSLPHDTSYCSRLKMSAGQLRQLDNLLYQFAAQLSGSNVSDEKIEGYYEALVTSCDYCPGNDDWFSLFSIYLWAPAYLREQAKTNLINSVQAFSQNYHSSTVEFVEKAKKIFTSAQLDEILK